MDENKNFIEEKIAENNEEQGFKINLESKEAFFEEQETKEIPKEPFFTQALTKEQLEKIEIKKIARVAGIAFLSLYGVMLLLNLLIILLARVFSSSIGGVMEIISDPALTQLQQILFSVTVFTLPFIIVFKLSKFRISGLISFSLPKGKNSFYLFLIGIAFCSFANVAASLAESIFDNAGINYEVDFGENPNGILGFILSFLATAIVPALAEEFACRGILLGALKKYGEGFAIIVSSVMFGVMHGNFEQIPFAFLVGLVLAFITVKANTIWIAVAVHFFNNSVSVIYTYFLSGISGTAQNISYTVFLILSMLLGLFALTKIKGQEELFSLSADTLTSPLSKRVKWFLLSPPVIAYTAICLLQSMSYFVI